MASVEFFLIGFSSNYNHAGFFRLSGADSGVYDILWVLTQCTCASVSVYVCVCLESELPDVVISRSSIITNWPRSLAARSLPRRQLSLSLALCKVHCHERLLRSLAEELPLFTCPQHVAICIFWAKDSADLRNWPQFNLCVHHNRKTVRAACSCCCCS